MRSDTSDPRANRRSDAHRASEAAREVERLYRIRYTRLVTLFPPSTCRAFMSVRPDKRHSTVTEPAPELCPDALVSCSQAARLLSRSEKFFRDHIGDGDLVPRATGPLRLRWGDCVELDRNAPRRQARSSKKPEAAPPNQPGRSTETGRLIRERVKQHEQARRQQ
jgi:hypothetical protein